MKKVKKILIIFILILFIILIREFIINNNEKIDKSNSLSREQIIQLLNKGATADNYSLKRTTELGEEEMYYKNNILTYYINSDLKYWININPENKEFLIFDDFDDNIVSTVEDFEEMEFPLPYTQLGYYITLYDTSNFDFKYIGKTQINNRNTIVAKSIDNTNPLSIVEMKYYIDEETGIVVKRTDTYKCLIISTKSTTSDRGIEFNTVSDTKIAKPNMDKCDIFSTQFPAFGIW